MIEKKQGYANKNKEIEKKCHVKLFKIKISQSLVVSRFEPPPTMGIL